MSKKRRPRSHELLRVKGSKMESPRNSPQRRSTSDQPLPHGYMDDWWLEEQYFWTQRKGQQDPSAEPHSVPPREWDPWMDEWMLDAPPPKGYPSEKEAPWARTDVPMGREYFGPPPFPREPWGKGEAPGNKGGELQSHVRPHKPGKEWEPMPESFDETAGLNSVRKSSRKTRKSKYRK